MQALDWLPGVLAGKPDAEAVEHMVAGVQTWWRSGTRNGGRSLTLARCMGLPESSEAARLALRDHWLRQAACTLPGGPWQRAVALHAALQSFRGHRWPCWCDLVEPPAHADPLRAALHQAMRAAGGRMPGTPRRLAQILA
jgi:hypothetical protein